MTALGEAGVADAAAPRAGWRAGTTLALCFAAALAEGYDITSMGVAAPRLGPALALSREQLGPVFSASILGLFVGALLIGRLADRIGRKWTLVGSMAVFAGFSAATAFAHGFDDLIAIRVLAGAGLGGAMPNLIALAAEVVAEQRRALMVTVVASGMPFGGAVVSAVAAAPDWRAIFYVGGAAPFALALLMVPALSESPGVLRARSAPIAAAAARRDFGWVLLGEGRGPTSLLLWLGSFCSLMSLYLLLNWLPTLMAAKGISRQGASLVALLFNLGGGLGVLTLAALFDRGRRRAVLLSWYAGLVGALIALAWVGASPIAAGAAGFAAGGFICSAPIILYGLAPGYYRVAMRATGVGASVAVGRLGAIVGPLFAAALLSGGVGVTGLLLALSPLAAMAGAASLALLGRPTISD